MSGEPKTLTPEQKEVARAAFETRYVGYRWWLERFNGEQHPALRKDKDGVYESEYERHLWKGFQEGYAAALGVRVVARDDAAELQAQVSRLQEALAFAQSVIKSGEEWSPTCDEIIGAALAASEGQS